MKALHATLSMLCLACATLGCQGDTGQPYGPASSSTTPEATPPAAAESAPLEVITEANFEEKVLGSSQPVLVDCWAAWCKPCLMLEPTIKELAVEFEGRVTVGKLNVDENGNIARELGISSIPAVFIFKDGKIVEKLIGVQPRQNYVTALERVLNGQPS